MASHPLQDNTGSNQPGGAGCHCFEKFPADSGMPTGSLECGRWQLAEVMTFGPLYVEVALSDKSPQ